MPDVKMHDRVQMRKKHPCGSDEWVIDRLGADIGMTCSGCGRRVLLARAVFNKRLKKIIQPSSSMPSSSA
jgi:hypothetical protein